MAGWLQRIVRPQSRRQLGCKACIITDFQKTILLYTIDEAWERHLLAYGQNCKTQSATYRTENKDP